MATLTGISTVAELVADIRSVSKIRLGIWLIAVGTLTTLLVLLALAIDGNAVPSQDRTVSDWVVDRSFPGLTGSSEVVSFMSNNWPAMGLGIVSVLFLWLVGLTRVALGVIIVGGVIGLVAFISDFTLGEIVGRSRPLLENSENSFPSAHTFGSTIFLGFFGFLAVYYRVKIKLLIPVLGFIFLMILAVGFSRMFEQAHWPSDVAAGYLLGSLVLLWAIPFFVYFQRLSWLSTPKQASQLEALECESCRIEGSIASTVVLNPEEGTATKFYSPPKVVRVIYWLAFQAKFPYEHNHAALEAAVYRRKIASALTIHRFGKDLVAHVTAVNCMHAACNFVTDYVPGQIAENDEETREFLGQVVETFTEAGLSVWQMNPRNPHAHTNIIRNLDGDPIIIDLESAVATPIPGPGQWRSALRSGNIPVFDDIDFERLWQYVETNQVALEESLGRDGYADLKTDVESCEQAIRTWHASEPRIWGRLIRGVYRLFDWKRFFMRLSHGFKGADKAAESFLNRGIERWESEERLTPSEIASLRSHISSKEGQDAVHHMGVHLVLSVVIVVPIPGLRSLARAGWTFVFWIKAQGRRLLRKTPKTSTKVTNVHTPLVMVLALIPGFGGVAYLASRPLRKKLLIRLMLDQIAFRLPFKLYTRTRLNRMLAPPKPKAA